jgi:hypothetical protein
MSVPYGAATLRLHVSPPAPVVAHGLGVVTGKTCACAGVGVPDPFGTAAKTIDSVFDEMKNGRRARDC